MAGLHDKCFAYITIVMPVSSYFYLLDKIQCKCISSLR